MGEVASVALLTSRGLTGDRTADVTVHGNPIEGHVVLLAAPVRFEAGPGEACLVIGARLTALDGRESDTRLLSQRIGEGDSYTLETASWMLP